MLINYSILNEDGLFLKIHRITQEVIQIIHRNSNSFHENYERAIEWLIPQLKYD